MSELGTTPLTEFALKGEARALVEASRQFGPPLRLSLALDRVSRSHGFRDWNALKASLKTGPHRVQASGGGLQVRDEFEPLEELPPYMAWSDSAGGYKAYAALQTVSGWSKRLEVLADVAQEGGHAKMLQHISAARPYLLERNLSRWSDGKFYLVDRNYTEVPGFSFSHQELESFGVPAWVKSGYVALSAGETRPLLDDRFLQVADRRGCKLLARVLASMALTVQRRVGSPVAA